ncbi:MAG: hypothetical protein AAGC92_01405 [Pseudomonadota bacterium]
MTSKLVRLDARDEYGVDGDVIAVMRSSLGDAEREDMIEDSAFRLVELLSRLEFAQAETRLSEVARLARSIAEQCQRIGLKHMAAVAQDLTLCAQRADAAATHAVAARLIRIGEDALFTLTRYID